MAGELKIIIDVSYSKGGSKIAKTYSNTIDVAGDAYGNDIQSIPTSNTALTLPAAIGTTGWVIVKNLDTTNYVSVGLTGSYTVKLLPGQSAAFPAAGAPYALANTATCLVEKLIFEL
jgi:hypothetical protein